MVTCCFCFCVLVLICVKRFLKPVLFFKLCFVFWFVVCQKIRTKLLGGGVSYAKRVLYGERNLGVNAIRRDYL